MKNPLPIRRSLAGIPCVRGSAGALSALLAAAVLLLSEAAPAGAGTFAASDASTNEPYASQGSWNIGDNGGTGFGGWQLVGSAEPNRSIDRQGFGIFANDGVGEAAVGRSFADGVALASGSFTAGATHDSAGQFSGFALYSATDGEIFRWGVTTADGGDGTYAGFWYAVGDGGPAPRYESIHRFDDYAGASVTADYSVSWSVFSAGMYIDLTIDSDSYAGTGRLTLGNSSAVTAIAAIAAGATQADTLHFDDLSVTGQAVPEPATLSLLLLGALALRPLRRK